MNDLHTQLEQYKQSLAFQKQKAPVVGHSSTPSSTVECFSVQAPPGFSEHFVDFRFLDGNKVAFPYAELTVINFDAVESKLDLNFRGYWVCIYGSNLDSDLYESLRDCRVRWIAETAGRGAISGNNSAFVTSIEVFPPDEAVAQDSDESYDTESENYQATEDSD